MSFCPEKGVYETGEIMKACIGVGVGELTTQSMIHAAVNSSEDEPTTMPTKYFGNITAASWKRFSLLHIKYDSPSHLFQVFKIAWNLFSGGKRGATRSPKTASRSMSGTTPNPVGHCIVSKKHKMVATGYSVDAGGSKDAIGTCRMDAIMLFACRMSEVSGEQGWVNWEKELGKANIRFQIWRTSSRRSIARVSELKTSTQKSGKPPPGATWARTRDGKFVADAAILNLLQIATKT